MSLIFNIFATSKDSKNMKTFYKKRIADLLLTRKLQGKGAVLIEGPKWCGKTTTAKQFSNSLLDLGDSSILTNAKIAFQVNPSVLLEGETPKLLDEWQSIPPLWDMVRSEVDRRQALGQFIMTGSSVPPQLNQLQHSGTGRIGRIQMRPMSLWESGESSGTVSLSELFDGIDISTQSNILSINDIAYLICRGGWPQSTLPEGDIALDQAQDYFEDIYQRDIHRIDDVRRSTERTRLLLRSYARHQGSAISFNRISEDIKKNDNMSVTYETVADYVEV